MSQNRTFAISDVGQQRRIGPTCNGSAHPPNSRRVSGHALVSPSGPIGDIAAFPISGKGLTYSNRSPPDHTPRGGTGMELPRRQFVLFSAGAALLPVGIARAQTYPTRAIRLVIPFPPGGAYDAVGRPWADKVKPLLGTVVVENLGGAGGSVGAATVAHARPDG